MLPSKRVAAPLLWSSYHGSDGLLLFRPGDHTDRGKIVLARSSGESACAEPAGRRDLRADGRGIAEYKFDSNGMHVILFPDNSKPTTTVNITYLVGSRFENYGETGMAHLLEHLMFRGSKNHPDTYAEPHCARLPSNGSTWFDRTNYFETFAAVIQILPGARVRSRPHGQQLHL